MSNGFSSQNPEDGHYWRALTAEEAAIFEDRAQTYGRSDLTELHGMASMKGKSCARFFSSKRNARDWAKMMGQGAKVLAVPKGALTHGSEYDVWARTDDVYITGTAARLHGVAYDLDQVP